MRWVVCRIKICRILNCQAHNGQVLWSKPNLLSLVASICQSHPTWLSMHAKFRTTHSAPYPKFHQSCHVFFPTEQVPFPDVPPVSMKILCSGSIPRTSWQASVTTVGKSHKWITWWQRASQNSAMYTVYTLNIFIRYKSLSSTNLKPMHQLSTMSTTVATYWGDKRPAQECWKMPHRKSRFLQCDLMSTAAPLSKTAHVVI